MLRQLGLLQILSEIFGLFDDAALDASMEDAAESCVLNSAITQAPGGDVMMIPLRTRTTWMTKGVGSVTGG